MKAKPGILGIAVILYCAWRSEELLNAWAHSPMDRFGWIAFVLWLTPIAIVGWKHSQDFETKPGNQIALGAGLVISLAGTMSSMNMAYYIGLALALMALIRWRITHWIWLPGALMWMPVFGYTLAKAFSLNHREHSAIVFFLRITLTILSLVPSILVLSRIQPDESKSES